MDSREEVKQMSAEQLIAAKKELRKLQNVMGKELAKGKYKDTVVIQDLKHNIRSKKLQIGDITKSMIAQLSIE